MSKEKEDKAFGVFCELEQLRRENIRMRSALCRLKAVNHAESMAAVAGSLNDADWLTVMYNKLTEADSAVRRIAAKGLGED